MIAFNCPTCEKHFKLSDRFAGRNLFCSDCRTEIVVPEPEEELGLAPMPTPPPTLPPPTPSSQVDIYAIPITTATRVRRVGTNIEFDCASCGKHYVMTSRFVGRPMLCSGCKSELNVPEPSEDEPGTPEPAGEIPDVFEEPLSFPVPPPPPSLPVPPPTDGFTSSSGFAGFDAAPPVREDDTDRYENAVATRTDEDSAILAYVYHEKHNESQPTASPPPPPPPAPLEETVPKSRRRLFWPMILGVLVLIFGTCLYLNLFIDWSGPDRRPELLERIARRKTDAATEAGVRENEAELLRFKAMEAWNTVGDLADNYLITFGELDAEQNTEENSKALWKRLDDFEQQIHNAEKQAVDDEAASRKALRDRDRLRAEARFYETEETKLAEQIRSNPKDRTELPFPEFAAGRTGEPEKNLAFDSDWTENEISDFAFSGVDEDRLFASFDGVRRVFGNRSLRLTLLEKSAVKIVFPGGGELRRNGREFRKFIFSIRFPGIGDRLIVGGDPNEGKIGEILVRFVNSSGRVDFRTVSPRYCEALYYEAAGKFTTVEIPFSGDSLWQRTDHFDPEKIDRSDDAIEALLSGGPAEDAADGEVVSDPFFHRIDRVEIHFMPLSDRTAIWFDGIGASKEEASLPYDLERAESLQAQIRNQDRELRRQRRAVTEEMPEPPAVEPETVVETPKPEEPPEFDGADEQRLRKQFTWILQESGGRLRARVLGRSLSFGSKSPIPDPLDDVVIEEVDLSRCRNITDEKLDQLGSLKELKKLDLSHTGLKNGSLIRLATLTSLESLNLGGNDLTFEGMPGIQTLKNLRTLNLDGIRSSVEGIDALGNMTGLRSLSLAQSLTDSGDLIYLLTLTNLETLDLSGSKIGDRALETLRAFPTLQSLDISKTRITSAGVARLDNLAKLRHLNLDETAVNDTCLRMFRKLENMETVSAKKTKITRDGVRHALGAVWIGRFELSD